MTNAPFDPDKLGRDEYMEYRDIRNSIQYNTISDEAVAHAIATAMETRKQANAVVEVARERLKEEIL